MSTLSVKPSSAADAKIASVAKSFQQRIEAIPPGSCPIVVLASHCENCASQTCGKCVPCRDGLPQLAQQQRFRKSSNPDQDRRR